MQSEMAQRELGAEFIRQALIRSCKPLGVSSEKLVVSWRAVIGVDLIVCFTKLTLSAIDCRLKRERRGIDRIGKTS